MNYTKELSTIKSALSHELYKVLKVAGAYIAGGALTSVFSNKEINDIDVYFPSAQAFSDAVKAVYGKDETPEDMFDWLSTYQATAVHVSKRALLLTVGGQKVQFIAHKFYEKPEDIFKTFDFTINMAVWDLKNDNLLLHDDFLKHLSQRYIQINANTSYPLVSVLRVNKYKDKGFNCSKSQLLKLLLAVNKLKIESWEDLFDQLGGMYGTAPEDIFDKTKPFNLESAIDTLDAVEFKETIFKNNPGYEDVMVALPFAFPRSEVLAEIERLQKIIDQPKPSWYGADWTEKESKAMIALKIYLED